MREKLGLTTSRPEDRSLAETLQNVMAAGRLDYTQTFRHLGDSLPRDNPSEEDSPGGFLGGSAEALAWIERLAHEPRASEPQENEQSAPRP